MIPAPPGTYAHFRGKIDGTEVNLTRQVIAFDDAGEAMILGREHLIRASDDPGFVGVDEYAPPHSQAAPRAFIPGGGWVERNVWVADDGRKMYLDLPVVAWVMEADGEIVPYAASDAGATVERVKFDADGTHVYHPDWPWDAQPKELPDEAATASTDA